MQPGFALIFVAVLAAVFVPLALSDRRSLILRSAYVLVGALLTLMLGVLFAGFSAPKSDLRAVPAFGVEVEAGTRWAARGLGGCLALLAGGELLRLILRRTAGPEAIGSVVVFLGGVLLVEPQWGSGSPCPPGWPDSPRSGSGVNRWTPGYRRLS
jgi:hypothetical protein